MGHAVAEALEEGAFEGLGCAVGPEVASFVGIILQVVEFAGFHSVEGIEFVGGGAKAGCEGLGFVLGHGVEVFAIDGIAMGGGLFSEQREEGAALHAGVDWEAGEFEECGGKVGELGEG